MVDDLLWMLNSSIQCVFSNLTLDVDRYLPRNHWPTSNGPRFNGRCSYGRMFIQNVSSYSYIICMIGCSVVVSSNNA